MNINILRYFLFGIAGGQEVDRIFVKGSHYSIHFYVILTVLLIV